MAGEIDPAALRDEIARVYGVQLANQLITELGRCGDSDPARVALADRLATAIEAAGPVHAAEPTPAPAWAPLPVLDAVAGADPAVATERMVDWAQAGGARFDAFEIRTSPAGYRTGWARRAIAAGDQVIYVPRDLVFDLERAHGAPVGQAVAAAGLALASERTVLALALLAERRDPTSRWQPYLAALPRLPAHPLFHDAAELAPLAGSAALDDLHARRSAITADHQALAALAGPGDGAAVPAIALAELAWARAICASRTFAVTIDGIASAALIPIADCCDHGTGDVRWAYDDRAGGLVVTAARQIAAGEPIQLSYGARSNARLFAAYGFCLPDNPADTAQLTVPPPLGTAGALIARLVWDQPLGAPWHVEVGRRFDSGLRALALARLAVATPRELLAALDRGCFRDRQLRWIGERNEAAAWSALAAAAGDRLAAWPAATGASATIAHLLDGERQILAAWHELAEAAPPLLRGASWWDARRIAATGGDSLLAQYLAWLAGELAR